MYYSSISNEEDIHTMDNYMIIITVVGAAALGMAWMPAFTERTNISYSIVYVLIGVLLYLVIGELPFPDPLWKKDFTLHFTELIVIISLMATGLKIDQPFLFKTWSVPFRLVIVTMLLSIAVVTFLGWWSLGFDLASALLLGAVLAPTDPVLASDVQVGPPHETHGDNIRFSLTAEAGLNDGMAFPFTWLAISLVVIQQSDSNMIAEWFLWDFVYKISIGVISGLILGRSLAYLLFRFSEKNKLFATSDGFVAVSITLMVYGVTELIRGYGFIAVFVAAIALRNFEMNHKYHQRLHDFIEQIERLFLAILLILFGGSLAMGLIDQLTWQMALFGLCFVFIIRPVTAYAALINTKLHFKEKMAISFFGIKGAGSFFYLAFALKQIHFTSDGELWSMTGFIVLLSIIIHGFSASWLMKKLGKEFNFKINR